MYLCYNHTNDTTVEILRWKTSMKGVVMHMEKTEEECSSRRSLREFHENERWIEIVEHYKAGRVPKGPSTDYYVFLATTRTGHDVIAGKIYRGMSPSMRHDATRDLLLGDIRKAVEDETILSNGEEKYRAFQKRSDDLIEKTSAALLSPCEREDKLAAAHMVKAILSFIGNEQSVAEDHIKTAFYLIGQTAYHPEWHPDIAQCFLSLTDRDTKGRFQALRWGLQHPRFRRKVLSLTTFFLPQIGRDDLTV